jgi:hypothetical protein
MATDSPLQHLGWLNASADLSAAANQYKAVKSSGNLTVNLASTGGENALGILQNTPANGDAADIGIGGVSKALVGVAGCAYGDALQTEAATGAVVTKTSTNAVIARALQAGVSGDIISVVVIPN